MNVSSKKILGLHYFLLLEIKPYRRLIHHYLLKSNLTVSAHTCPQQLQSVKEKLREKCYVLTNSKNDNAGSHRAMLTKEKSRAQMVCFTAPFLLPGRFF